MKKKQLLQRITEKAKRKVQPIKVKLDFDKNQDGTPDLYTSDSEHSNKEQSNETPDFYSQNFNDEETNVRPLHKNTKEDNHLDKGNDFKVPTKNKPKVGYDDWSGDDHIFEIINEISTKILYEGALKQNKKYLLKKGLVMRKEQILSEELARMRQLMGMSGQLYQKPIMDEDAQEAKGHIAVLPNPADYKGGEKNKTYISQLAVYQDQHPPASPPPSPPASPPPSPPPAPPPAPPAPAAKIKTPPASKARPKKGTGADSSGSFIGSRFGKRGTQGTKGSTKKISRGKASKKGKKKRKD